MMMMSSDMASVGLRNPNTPNTTFQQNIAISRKRPKINTTEQ